MSNDRRTYEVVKFDELSAKFRRLVRECCGLVHTATESESFRMAKTRNFATGTLIQC